MGLDFPSGYIYIAPSCGDLQPLTISHLRTDPSSTGPSMPDVRTTDLNLKPNHKAVNAYYTALAKFEKLGVKHEGAVASAFEDLLDHCARQTGRALIPKYILKL